MSAIPMVLISGHISTTNLEDSSKEMLSRALTIPNPAYQVMLRKGNVRALYGIKSEFKHYEDKGGVFKTYRGTRRLIMDHLKSLYDGLEEDEELFDPKIDKPLPDEVKPRDYQKETFEKFPLHEKEGIIHLPTGWGKSVLACHLTRKTGSRTLIICPRDAIMGQFEEEYLKWYGLKVGVIKGKRWDVRDVTVASISTLTKDPEKTAGLADKFGLVIADEAHTYITDKRIEALACLKSERFYGMTATPARSDGQSKAVFFLFGPVIVTGMIDRENPTVYKVATGSKILTDEYHLMIDELVEDADRNRLIIDIVNRETSEGRKTLILTKRISHYRHMADGLDGIVRTVDSESGDKERKELLSALRSGSAPFDVILGTYSMLSTGVDIPKLETLVFAGDLKSDVLTTQCAGRILRLFSGKKSPKIYDMIDSSNPILNRQAKSRASMYRKNGWNVLEYLHDGGDVPVEVHQMAQS